MNYVKLPLTYEQQIQNLKNHGLVIENETEALDILRRVNYFRLANYLRPMEIDKVSHQFKDGARFENAVALYNFDRELRLLLFKEIQSIEIALRTKVIHNVSLIHGSFWFMDDSLANDMGMHAMNLAHVCKEVGRSKEDFILEHGVKYTTPDLPPVWKTFEVLSFGTLSKLFENLRDNSAKKQVAREFNLPQHIVLESWIRAITVLRNCVAHHARVWNRKFPVKPLNHKKMRGAWVKSESFCPERLFAQLCCLQYLEDAINPNNVFKIELKALLAKYPTVDVAAMGFPNGWEMEPLWM